MLERDWWNFFSKFKVGRRFPYAEHPQLKTRTQVREWKVSVYYWGHMCSDHQKGFHLACRNLLTAPSYDFDKFSMVSAIFPPSPFIGALANVALITKPRSALTKKKSVHLLHNEYRWNKS